MAEYKFCNSELSSVLSLEWRKPVFNAQASMLYIREIVFSLGKLVVE